MSDPLSVSASVAGLLSLTIVVLDSTYQYISSVRNAPTSARSLFAELNELKTVLLRLYELTHDASTPLPGSHLKKDAHLLFTLNMDICKTDLDAIQRKIEKRASIHGAAKMLHRLTWPFVEAETLQLVEKLHRYGKVFHMALAADDFAVNKTTLIEVKSLRENIERDTKRKAVLQWICPNQSQAVQATLRSQRQSNTGQWFLDLVQSQWLDQSVASSPVFWCRAGSGKTILTSFVVDYASSARDKHGIRAVACIYYNYKQQSSQNTPAILGDIVRQLLSQLPGFWPVVEELFERRANESAQPTVDDLIEVMQRIEEPEHILLAIDALDEAASLSRDSLLRQLNKLAILPMRLFLTSRPDIDLRGLKTHVCVAVTASEADLTEYVYRHLEEDSNVQDILDKHSDTIIPKIAELIVSQASGMFLLVVFQIHRICHQTSAREMLEVANAMPSNPKSIYSQTMEQIDLQSPAQKALAKRVLSWLTLACRSITPQELCEALAIELDTQSLDPLNKRSVAMLAKVCRGLVVVDEENSLIQLAHKTVQEYLLSSEALDLPSMQREIFLSCITYLSFGCFREGPCETAKDLSIRLKSHPFLTYAACHLGDHFNLISMGGTLLEQLYSFIICKPLAESFLQVRNISQSSNLEASAFLVNPFDFVVSARYHSGVTPLHIATVIGNAVLVRMSVERLPELLDISDAWGRTALRWAVISGCEAVVEILLNANAATEDNARESLLNCAARCKFDGIVRLLLQHNASLQKPASNLSNEVRGRELLVAAIKGDDEMIRNILEGNIDVDVRDSDGGTSLQWAAWYGHTNIIGQLLDHGAEIDASDLTSGRRALHEAAEHGCYSALRLLLDRGAKIDALDKWAWTALHRAAYQGGPDVTELLLSNSADINAVTTLRDTALHLACQNVQLDTIRLLIGKGINIDKFSFNDVRFRPTISDSRRAQVKDLLLTLIPQCVKPTKGEKWRRVVAAVREAEASKSSADILIEPKAN